MKIRCIEDLIRWEDLITEESKAKLQAIGRPSKLALKKTPENLDDITLGQLITLWRIKDEWDLFYLSAICVLAYDDNDRRYNFKQKLIGRRLRHTGAGKAIGWSNFVSNELLRINEMWQKCNVPLTDIDRQAGADNLNFGFFSIIDAYAQRQGITDHDDVLKVKWIKVWQSLQKDAEIAKFQLRRERILENRFKQNKTKNEH